MSFSQPTTGTLLRIFIDEEDRRDGRPLYTAIVEALKAAGFAGATVLKGIEGFGVRGQVRSARAADFSANLPIVIEVFDEREKTLAFVPTLRAMIPEGLITLENVQLMHLRRGQD